MRGGDPAGTRRAGRKVSPRSELINDFTPNATWPTESAVAE